MLAYIRVYNRYVYIVTRKLYMNFKITDLATVKLCLKSYGECCYAITNSVWPLIVDLMLQIRKFVNGYAGGRFIIHFSLFQLVTLVA